MKQKGSGIIELMVVLGTVFFIDMRNFTFLCSKMPGNPREDRILDTGQTQYDSRLFFLLQTMERFYDEWYRLLDNYLHTDELTRIVFHSTGDGVMVGLQGDRHYRVAFTAVRQIAAHIHQALTGGINDRLEELGIKRRGDRLDFGIGVCSGAFTYVRVPYGLGEQSRNTNNILGTAPNLAARIQDLTKDYANAPIIYAHPTIQLLCEEEGIPLSDSRRIEDRFGLRYLSKRPLRGAGLVDLFASDLDSSTKALESDS